MSKLLVVLDTNVLISAAFGIPGSIPDKILQFLKSQKFILIISPSILEEIEDVINREAIIRRTKMSLKEREQFINNLIDIAFIVSGNLNLKVVKDDPDDDKFIVAAVEGYAQYIISGDKHLLNIKSYQGIKILSPKNFVRLLIK